MSILRRLSHEVRQVLLNSSKQNCQPLSVTFFTKSSPLDHNAYKANTVNLNTYQDFVKHNFHTSSNNRDIETGLKCIGSGLSMIGALGPGIGIGAVYGNLLAGVARNPSTKDQLFTMAIMGTVFCETICLFCFLISIIILNS